MRVAAVIPAHNEAKYIKNVVLAVRPYVDYVLIVDDGSTDETPAITRSLADEKVIDLHHEVNLGKGSALRTGCEAACQLKVDAIICMDADGQHNPDHIPNFIALLKNEPVDIVFGVRQFNRFMPLTMLIGNHLLSNLINYLFHVKIHDSQSGYRAFTTSAYERIKWESRGYEAETEMITRINESQLRYREIDIDTIYFDGYKGTTVLDGFKIFFYILRWKFL